MAAIIFGILKIIGIVLAVILVLLLFALIFTVLSPIRFGFKIKTESNTKAEFYVNCFFKLFWVKGSYFGEDIHYDYGYPFRGVRFSVFKKSRKSKANKTAPEKNTPPAKPLSKKETTDNKKESVEKAELKSVKNSEKNNNSHTGNNSGTNNGKSENLTNNSIINSIKEYWELFSKTENKKNVINCLFKNIKYIINKTKFNVKCLNVTFGFDDPALTGKALGGLYASGLPFIAGARLEGDFDKSVFNAEADISGKIRLIFIITAIIKIIINKETMNAIMLILNREG